MPEILEDILAQLKEINSKYDAHIKPEKITDEKIEYRDGNNKPTAKERTSEKAETGKANGRKKS